MFKRIGKGITRRKSARQLVLEDRGLRNYSLSGSLLSPEASLDVIPYFEQTLVQLKEFIKNIITKEPLLYK
jgi:hypothetical protein